MTTVPSPWRLAALRGLALRQMPETVEVWRGTPVVDGKGGTTTTLARATTMPGRVEAPNERSQIIADRMGVVASAVVVLPHDASPRAGDELRVGTHRYTFVGSDDALTRATELRCIVTEVR